MPPIEAAMPWPVADADSSPPTATHFSPSAVGVPLKERWFEDYVAGESFEFGEHRVTQDEIVAFASRYDPQSFHVDPVAARDSAFGGLIASGWMTAALVMKMMCAHFISVVSALGSPGVDNLRWLRPVRPGDRLHVRVMVLAARPSASRPGRGTVSLRQEAINQDGEVVMSLEGRSMHRCRPAAPGAPGRENGPGA